MHDDFFFPMAEETKAILKVVRNEVPDNDRFAQMFDYLFENRLYWKK